MTDGDITMCVEEIMFGAILLPTKYLKTAKRTIERMNNYLEFNGYEWRVELFKNEDKKFPYGAKMKED